MNNGMTFPGGYIFDYFGTAVTRHIAIVLYTGATLLIALSTAENAVFLFPALSLLATGGVLLILTNIQVGNLFGSQRSTIITLYNGAFDSSSVIFLIVKILYQNGVSLRITFLVISSCSICHIIRTFFLMPKKHIPYPLPEGYHYGLQCRTDDAETSNPPELSTQISDGEKGRNAQIQVTDKSISTLLKHEDQPGEEASFWSCALSSLFGCHFIWLSVIQLRHYMFIGTLNPTLTHLTGGDPEKVSYYTNVFAISQFCGVLCAPWNGLILDRHKKKNIVSDSLDDLRSTVLSLALTAVQCMLFSLFASISILPILYSTFILQVLNRSFLYGGNAAFLAIAFPPKHFGKLYGLVMSLSAIVSLLQYPAFYIIRTQLNGDPFYVNIFFLILGLLAFIHPFNVFRIVRRKQLARENRDK
ncbi:equilibrative nucleobase transporter 1 isoform 2-T3 [Discoglossus pictus]